MKLAIMQPYLFPYVGYIQLVGAVDKFVFYDDVAFIKNGWINRNRLIFSGEPRYFTVPLLEASSFRKISEVGVQAGGSWRRKILESMRQSYSNMPHFPQVFDLVAAVIEAPGIGIGEMAKRSVVSVAQYLNLAAEFVWSSSEYRNEALRGSARVLDICEREGADEYYNLPGGRELYDSDRFAAHGVRVRFVEPHAVGHFRGADGNLVALSIIDVLMRIGASETARALTSMDPGSALQIVTPMQSDGTC